jgi:hypothetical protein
MSELGCQPSLSFYTYTISLFCRENKVEEQKLFLQKQFCRDRNYFYSFSFQMELAYRIVYVKIVYVGLVWSVDVRFLPYCSLLLVSLVLFSFCSMLLLLIWLF